MEKIFSKWEIQNVNAEHANGKRMNSRNRSESIGVSRRKGYSGA